MLVRKRDGRIIEFNKEKISLAIIKAMEEVHHVNERTALRIANEISKLDYEVIDIEEIQDIVEQKLMASSLKDVAKAYILYRDERTRLRGNTIDKQIKEIVEGTNEYWNTENSNKNPKIASTQRDYMAGQVSEDISRRELLPRDIVEAHDNGLIHFHDIDYFAQHIFNCCLVNLEDMLQNGTVINGTMIEKPHSFSTACNIAT